MNNKESKTNVTLSEALRLKKQYTDKAKELSDEVKNTGKYSTLDELFATNENLYRVSIALLKANSDLGHNERIKQRDITLRNIEVMEGILARLAKPQSTLSKIKRALHLDDRCREDQLVEMITEAKRSVADLEKAIQNFNDSNTIEILLYMN